MSKTPLPAAARQGFVRDLGKQSSHHFAGAGKPITGGKRAVRIVDNCHPCETSGNNPANRFAGAGKMVDLGSARPGSPREEHR